MQEITVLTLRKLKKTGQKIVMITAYDFPSAKLADQAGVDVILVGDSLGVVVLGYQDTLTVTMADMLHHTKAVARGVQRAMIVGDLPFLSYQVSPELALANAGRFLKEAGAQAVKLEGGAEVAAAVAKITGAGIPVFGHLGFTPQSVHRLGGAIFQGKTVKAALTLIEDALRLEDAGACGLVLELVPWEVATLISERLAIPTIGICSGPDCDGQVLVYHDLLALNPDFQPRHNRIFGEAGNLVRQAIMAYASEVRAGAFPTESHTRRMAEAEYQQLKESLLQPR